MYSTINSIRASLLLPVL